MSHAGRMIDTALRWRAGVGIAAATTALLGIVGIVRPRWEAGGQELLEGWALLAVFGVPAAFALLSFLTRPALLLAAAVVSALTSPLLGFLMPILWGFAALYAMAFAHQPSRQSLAPTWAVVGLPVLLVLTGGSLILGSTEMTCVTNTVSRGTRVECGETTTGIGSTAALVLVAFAVAGGLALSSPRHRPPASI